LNGKAYENNWLGHFDLMKGATLDFDMIATPNTKRGTDKKSFPYSYSTDPNK
jgi:putative alpha-1,2-mannosidase